MEQPVPRLRPEDEAFLCGRGIAKPFATGQPSIEKSQPSNSGMPFKQTNADRTSYNDSTPPILNGESKSSVPYNLADGKGKSKISKPKSHPKQATKATIEYNNNNHQSGHRHGKSESKSDQSNPNTETFKPTCPSTKISMLPPLDGNFSSKDEIMVTDQIPSTPARYAGFSSPPPDPDHAEGLNSVSMRSKASKCSSFGSVQRT